MQEKNWETFINTYKIPLSLLALGVILVVYGAFNFQNDRMPASDSIEIIETDTTSENAQNELIVEISGEVKDPGVYKLSNDARIDDVIKKAGGLTDSADQVWMEKYLNKAAKIADGQKIYIPSVDEQSEVLSAKESDYIKTYQGNTLNKPENMININTASQKELESLWGIGPVYAQNIIEQRPYSTVEELLTKKIIKQNVYERNKDKMVVY